MSSKRILNIYFFILIVLFVLLTAFILIPFTIKPSLIQIIYGEDTLWYEAILTILLNLLYGLISSAALALFIALFSYQCDILRDEADYLHDIQNIIFLCKDAVEGQDVTRLLHCITLHQQKPFLLFTKPYRTCFLHSRKIKPKIQLLIEKIEEQIKTINKLCREIMNEELNYSKNLTSYNHVFAQMLYYPYYRKEHRDYKKQVANLSRILDVCQEVKKEEIQRILEPTRELNDAFQTLAEYLRSSTNNK